MFRLDDGRSRRRSSRVLCLMIGGVLASCAGRGEVSHANVPAAAPAPEANAANTARRDATPAEICVRVMRRTRTCAATYVPGLLALRVRLDQPSGISGRFQAKGRDAMLALARTQFARDWSDTAIARNCTALSEEPPHEQERIVAPDRRCLATDRCSTFTACDLAHKEARWTARPPAPASSWSRR